MTRARTRRIEGQGYDVRIQTMTDSEAREDDTRHAPASSRAADSQLEITRREFEEYVHDGRLRQYRITCLANVWEGASQATD